MLGTFQQAVDTAIEDIESRMASYELTSNLANEEFAEYLDNKISTMERAAEKRVPKRIVVADAATTPEQKPQTVELPSAKMVPLVPKEVVPVTAAPPAPKTTRSDSLP